MKRKAIAAVALAALGTSLLAACSGASPTENSAEKTITWEMWVGSQAETASWQHIADLVHQKEPSITVKLQTTSYNDFFTKLPTMLTGGDAPCVVGMQVPRLAQFSGLLKPLDSSMLKSAGVDDTEFDQSILEGLQMQGKQMALPYDLGPRVMFYNKDAFAAAGLADPTDGWTVDDFVSDARKLTSGSKYGFAANGTIDVANIWGPIVGGAQGVTSDGKIDVDTPGMVKTMDWYGGLVNKEHVAAQLTAASGSAASARDQFLSGNAAMYQSGPWDIINAKATAKFNVGVVPLPTGPNGAHTVVGGSGFGITNACSAPEAAMKALAAITGPDALEYLGSEGRAFPARTAQQASWYKSSVPGAKETLEAALKVASPYRSTATWTQDGLNWSQGVTSMVNGATPASEFLKSVQGASSSK